MKKCYSLLFLLMSLPSCGWFASSVKTVVGSGTIEKQSISLSKQSKESLNKLRVSGQGNVFFAEDNKESLVIEADDNLLENIIVEVDEKTLNISTKKNVQLQPKNPINYYISFKRPLEEIKLSGAVQVKAPQINTKKLKLKLDGASRVDAAIQAKKLDAEINGSAKVNLTGKVETQELEINGSAQYNAKNLLSKETEIESAGACQVIVSAQNKLKVKASGAVTIQYVGDPKLKIKKMGVVTIQKVG